MENLSLICQVFLAFRNTAMAHSLSKVPGKANGEIAPNT